MRTATIKPESSSSARVKLPRRSAFNAVTRDRRIVAKRISIHEPISRSNRETSSKERQPVVGLAMSFGVSIVAALLVGFLGLLPVSVLAGYVAGSMIGHTLGARDVWRIEARSSVT